jgi:hypothetical protein
MKLFAALLFPALVIAGFFIIQKSIYGWYFFPEHIGLIDADIIDFSAKFQSSMNIIFMGKNASVMDGALWLASFYAIRKKSTNGSY